jgi:hypothetical protein
MALKNHLYEEIKKLGHISYNGIIDYGKRYETKGYGHPKVETISRKLRELTADKKIKPEFSGKAIIGYYYINQSNYEAWLECLLPLPEEKKLQLDKLDRKLVEKAVGITSTQHIREVMGQWAYFCGVYRNLTGRSNTYEKQIRAFQNYKSML